MDQISTSHTSQQLCREVNNSVIFGFVLTAFAVCFLNYRVYKKKLNKPEIALRLCKAPQCTKFFIEIGCLGTDNAV